MIFFMIFFMTFYMPFYLLVILHAHLSTSASYLLFYRSSSLFSILYQAFLVLRAVESVHRTMSL